VAGTCAIAAVANPNRVTARRALMGYLLS